LGKTTVNRKAAALACLGLLAVCGCGLDDYEKNADRERERLEEFDRLAVDEAGFLGSPLENPQRKVVVKDRSGKPETREEDSLPTFFLKAPRGISTEGKPVGRGNLFRYQGGGTGGLFADLYLAGMERKDKEKKEANEDFQRDVCKDLAVPWQKPSSESVQGLGKRPTPFEKMTPAATTSVYFFEDSWARFAVIFVAFPNLDMEKKGEVKKAIQASLKTFETGSRASRLDQYAREGNLVKYYQFRREGP
jgi:hypothetical protein